MITVVIRLCDKEWSSVMWRDSKIEPLLLYSKKGHLSWFWHLLRMLPDQLWRNLTGWRPHSRPRTYWKYYTFHVRIPQNMLRSVSVERLVDFLGNLQLQPSPWEEVWRWTVFVVSMAIIKFKWYLIFLFGCRYVQQMVILFFHEI